MRSENRGQRLLLQANANYRQVVVLEDLVKQCDNESGCDETGEHQFRRDWPGRWDFFHPAKTK
jgi:hypothetical protein